MIRITQNQFEKVILEYALKESADAQDVFEYLKGHAEDLGFKLIKVDTNPIDGEGEFMYSPEYTAKKIIALFSNIEDMPEFQKDLFECAKEYLRGDKDEYDFKIDVGHYYGVVFDLDVRDNDEDDYDEEED
jgi:hypothetical protein